MKLYKFDYKGTIGKNVMTVPTDSQFLIGIGNGDDSSTAQLFDGTTEILPEDDKIGEYTCFRMETQGTQFRKPYKAVINGNNFEDKSLWTIFFEDVDYKDFTSIAFVIPNNVNIENLNYESGQAPVLTSFQLFVYGVDFSVSPKRVTYLETITLTWNASKTAYEIPIDMGGEGWVKYLQFSGCDNEDRLNGAYGQTSYNDVADFDFTADDGKETVPSPIPYTQNIDLYIICKKMSVAYRDETGLTSTEAVQAVKDSGEFVGKNEYGRYEIVGGMEILSDDGKTGTLSISGRDASGIELSMDEENEQIVAYGTIEGSDLTIKNATVYYPTIDSILDEDEQEYIPTEITVKYDGVEKNIVVYAHIL